MTTSDHHIEISRAVDKLVDEPDDPDIRRWITLTLDTLSATSSEVSIRIVSAEEIQELNKTYRDKDAPTNVLSFESGLSLPEEAHQPLGDIVLCSEIILDESLRFNKPFRDRFAHLVIHGLLHLMGHNHEQEEERQRMESLEISLLSEIHINDPYEMEVS